MSTESGVIALFEHYPELGRRIPRVPLGEFPTPVRRLDSLADDLDAGDLYIKRDDLAGKVFGGSKVRKLEFILGRAVESGAKEVLTFGFPGYKHPLDTTVCARQAGLRSICMMLPGVSGHITRRNLLMELHAGAELHHQRNMPLLVSEAGWVLLRHWLSTRRLPRFIRGSQSSRLGTVGCVNAAVELRDQIAGGHVPEPDLIYVPLGSMGTAVGLVLGLKATGLRSRVVAVRAASEKDANQKKMANLFGRTVRYLRSVDASFPRVTLSRDDLDVRDGSFGRPDALSGDRVQEAARRIASSEGIEFDRFYSGKALACLLEDAEKGRLANRVVLFWSTYDSRDKADEIAGVDYRELPRSFHRYFEDGAEPPGENGQR